MSQLAVVTNAILIAITSNFVGFEVYIRGGYDDEYNSTGIVPPGQSSSEQGLSGYANWSTTSFSVGVLVDGEAFPAFSAQSLELVNDDGSEISGTPLYLPYINFSCIIEYSNNCSFADEIGYFNVTKYGGYVEEVRTFTEESFERFFDDPDCRRLLFNASTKTNQSPRKDSQGVCFLNEVSCR